MRLKLILLLFLLQLAASVRLNCRFEIAESLEFVGELYGCSVGAIHVEAPNMTLERVDGSHMAGMTSYDVKAMFVVSQVLQFIPRGLGDTFKSMEALHIQSSELEVITKEDLQQFPKLKSFLVNDCKLQQLESGLFQFNPKLRVLQFQFNEISFIAADIFEPVKDLQKADFSANTCISNRALNRDQLEGLVVEIIRNCQPTSTNNVGSLRSEIISALVVATLMTLSTKFMFQASHLFF